MSRDIIIKLKENTDIEYALKFFKHIDFIKNVDFLMFNEKELEKNYSYIVSEKSLAEDWSSEEDERWDNLLKD